MKIAVICIAFVAVTTAKVLPEDEHRERFAKKFAKYERQPVEKRGPCPMLNTLANHGVINPDHVSGQDLFEALDILGIPNLIKKPILKSFTKGAQGDHKIFKSMKRGDKMWATMKEIGTHGFIEHDASLLRNDEDEKRSKPLKESPSLHRRNLTIARRTNEGATLVQEDLWNAFVKAAPSPNYHTWVSIRDYRVKREKNTNARRIVHGIENTLSVKDRFAGWGEAALFTEFFQSRTDLSERDYHVPMARLKEFFVDERMPADLIKNPPTVNEFRVLGHITDGFLHTPIEFRDLYLAPAHAAAAAVVKSIDAGKKVVKGTIRAAGAAVQVTEKSANMVADSFIHFTNAFKDSIVGLTHFLQQDVGAAFDAAIDRTFDDVDRVLHKIAG